jgi:hypothetical protein
LRGDLIHKKSEKIQCIPIFNPNEAENSDLLFISNNKIKKEEFRVYQNIFEEMGVKALYWDVDYYNGISYELDTRMIHKNTWIDKYKGKSIILASSPNDFSYFTTQDVYSHFDVNDSVHSSGFVVMGAEDKSTCKNIVSSLVENSPKFVDLDKETFSDYFITSSPSSEFMRDKERKILQEFAQKDTNHKFIIRSLYKPFLIPSDKFYAKKYCFGMSS